MTQFKNHSKNRVILYTDNGVFNTDCLSVEAIGAIWHRVDGPAYTEFDEEGFIKSEVWYHNDHIHRIGKPARITYSRSGQVHETYYLYGTEYTKEEYFEKLFNEQIKIL